MEIIQSFIKEVGFPVFVSVFLLVKMLPAINRLEITMAELLIFLKETKK